MATALEDLVTLLEVEPLEVNLFRGLSPDEERQRVFGGQVAGQALIAAGRTVEGDRHVHSLHAYFLRPGDPRVPIIYEVDRIRDGHSFTTRRVIGVQHGKAIFNLAASFQIVEDGPEHQYEMPQVPPPEELPTFLERVTPFKERFSADVWSWLERERPVETRSVESPRWIDKSVRSGEQHVWFKASGTLPDDPLLHACVVAYASDLTLLDTAVSPHQLDYTDESFQVASLDHAMWFHRPLRADEWLLYHQKSPSASGARGLAEGFIYARDGRLCATAIQEGLMRPRPNK